MTVGIAIPCKGTSNRLANKNMLEIDGRNLVVIAVEKLLKAECFDAIFVDTDSDDIWDTVKDYDVERMVRPPELASNATDGNGLIQWEYDAGLNKFDIICHFHCTSPLIKPETISAVITEFLNSNHDSVLTVKEAKDYFWKERSPTYDLDKVPNSFDLPSFLQETHAIYGIHKFAFERLRRRVGDNPMLKIVSEVESYDINNREDFEIVRTLGETLCRGSI